MKMMKTFDAMYNTPVWELWADYNEYNGMRGYISVSVDDDLRCDEEGEGVTGRFTPIYDWLIANGAEHDETVLVEFDW